MFTPARPPSATHCHPPGPPGHGAPRRPHCRTRPPSATHCHPPARRAGRGRHSATSREAGSPPPRSSRRAPARDRRARGYAPFAPVTTGSSRRRLPRSARRRSPCYTKRVANSPTTSVSPKPLTWPPNSVDTTTRQANRAITPIPLDDNRRSQGHSHVRTVNLNPGRPRSLPNERPRDVPPHGSMVGFGLDDDETPCGTWTGQAREPRAERQGERRKWTER
jgi:hypothetical protein